MTELFINWSCIILPMKSFQVLVPLPGTTNSIMGIDQLQFFTVL
jgi:hypothetical protein